MEIITLNKERYYGISHSFISGFIAFDENLQIVNKRKTQRL